MSVEIQRADPRLRRTSAIVLTLATVAAITAVLVFHQWMSRRAAVMSTSELVDQLRHWIGIALTASGLCLLALAAYSARQARRITEQRRWPLAEARLLRDTPIRRDAAALRVGNWLKLMALFLLLLAIAAGGLGWRMSTLT